MHEQEQEREHMPKHTGHPSHIATEQESVSALALSKELNAFREKIAAEQVPVHTLLHSLPPRALAMVSLIASLPFFLPLPMMGISTLMGLLIIFCAIGIILNGQVWVPKKIGDKQVPTMILHKAIEKLLSFSSKLERFVKPRLLWLSTPLMMKLNGLALIIAALILALPSPPGGNIPPALAIAAMSLGVMEEDGLWIGLGYILTALNIVGLTLIIIYGLEWAMQFQLPGY